MSTLDLDVLFRTGDELNSICNYLLCPVSVSWLLGHTEHLPLFEIDDAGKTGHLSHVLSAAMG